MQIQADPPYAHDDVARIGVATGRDWRRVIGHASPYQIDIPSFRNGTSSRVALSSNPGKSESLFPHDGDISDVI